MQWQPLAFHASYESPPCSTHSLPHGTGAIEEARASLTALSAHAKKARIFIITVCAFMPVCCG